MESLYDYGSRAGFWRLHRMFTQRNMPCTVFAVGMALERNQQACKAMVDAKWEVASHGYRWWDYQNVDPDTEREHIQRTIEIHNNLLGRRPLGFYQGKPNENTRNLIVQEGGFLYDSDSYADDLPYWTMDYGDKPHLIIPYTLSENDMKFVRYDDKTVKDKVVGFTISRFSFPLLSFQSWWVFKRTRLLSIPQGYSQVSL
jgi:peptidoglycan/xylan/chitin deacetylase (PgdA/CDA1 family)